MELHGLSFSPGIKIQEKLQSIFNLPVSSELSRTSFALVVSFGRCKFRLSIDSVGFLLQATIGGIASQFRVSQLSTRVFKFFVSSHQVGLFIRRLISFECADYKLFFHLWGRGGPNWQSEYSAYCKEERDSWTSVSGRTDRSRAPRAFSPALTGANAIPVKPVTGANRVPLGNRSNSMPRRSVFDRIVFPSKNRSVQQSLRREGPSAFDKIIFPNKNFFGQQFSMIDDSSLAKSQSSSVRVQNASVRANTSFDGLSCSRCLATSHSRNQCRNAIKCLVCNGWGHVAASCIKNLNSGINSHLAFKFKEKTSLASHPSSWFNRQPTGPSSSRPPTFASFGDFMGHLAGKSFQLTSAPPPPIIVNWSAPSTSDVGPVSCTLTLGCGFSTPGAGLFNGEETARSHDRTKQTVHRENPQETPLQFLSLSPPCGETEGAQSAMAYQRADPALFVPNEMHLLNVPGRVPMVRAVARSRPQQRNETVAIATINPLPGNVLHYPTVVEVLEEFFAERHIAISEIQPSHLGQALVCFNSPAVRDALILNSPLPLGDVQVSFARHNQGRNWRRVNFNHECWVILMGFPLDYWETDYIQDAVCSFGRVDNWINNRRRLARLLVRIRVADLQSIPQWIVYSDGVGNELESWTVQCEIVSHGFVGGGPPPEDQAPQQVDHLAPFDFFGLGQPGAGPMDPGPNQGGQGIFGIFQGAGPNQNQNEAHQNEEEQNEMEDNLVLVQIQENQIQDDQIEMVDQIEEEENPNAQWDPLAAQNAQNVAWDLWPDQQAQQLPNNQLIDNMEIDLNAPNPDMQEVIFNPIVPPDAGAGDFLELNDLIQNAEVEEEVIQPPVPPVPPVNQIQLALQDLQQPIPNLNLPIDHVIDDEDEIPMNQLLDVFVEEEQGAPEEEMDPDLNAVLNVGSVMIRDELGFDPVLAQRLNCSRLENHQDFCLPLSGNLVGKQIKVDSQWAPFFTSVLLSPGNFSWAKSFTESEAWKFFSSSLNVSILIVPDKSPGNLPRCTSDSNSTCSLQEIHSLPPKKDKKNKAPVVESEVRRSPRLKESNKGFKPNSCADKRCFACSPNPPDLPLHLMKKLGADFCQIDEKLLSEENLNQKRKKMVCKTAPDNDSTEDTGKKKKKKQMKENKKPHTTKTSKELQDDVDAVQKGTASKRPGKK